MMDSDMGHAVQMLPVMLQQHIDHGQPVHFSQAQQAPTTA